MAFTARSAAEAVPMPRMALTATAAVTISFDFFTAAPNGDSASNESKLDSYSPAKLLSPAIFRVPNKFNGVLQEKRMAWASETN
jgi:hypothetical protein